MAIGASETEPFWTEFLRDFVRCGLSGVKLVVSDAHERIMCPLGDLAALPCAFSEESARLCRQEQPPRRLRLHRHRLRQVRPCRRRGPVAPRRRSDAEQLPKLGGLLDAAEEDVLAYMTFPGAHRDKLHITNPV